MYCITHSPSNYHYNGWFILNWYITAGPYPDKHYVKK